MSDSLGIKITETATVEDVMVALAKQSIFDLLAAAQGAVKIVQEKAGEEDAPAAVFIHTHYVFVHQG